MECPNCGHRLKTSKSLRPDEEQSDVCPDCGEPIDKGRTGVSRRRLIEK